MIISLAGVQSIGITITRSRECPDGLVHFDTLQSEGHREFHVSAPSV